MNRTALQGEREGQRRVPTESREACKRLQDAVTLTAFRLIRLKETILCGMGKHTRRRKSVLSLEKHFSSALRALNQRLSVDLLSNNPVEKCEEAKLPVLSNTTTR